jgi:hypothetical protein
MVPRNPSDDTSDSDTFSLSYKTSKTILDLIGIFPDALYQPLSLFTQLWHYIVQIQVYDLAGSAIHKHDHEHLQINNQ